MIVLKKKFIRQKTINNVKYGCYYEEIFGLSTDTKPTIDAEKLEIVEEGSIFFEENTSNAYVMKANNSWQLL